ncbi:pyridoxal phosphate-dependent transferase [Pisolithus croceorrhizus]|nr:pyridoxal phosphate-dependent transferase [Pisolithus croceorrhizus]
MSHLYRHLRIHQVFGANTDVGKTIVTTALVRASALKNNTVFYLKPISTGPLHDADDKHIKRFAGPKHSLVETQCLFRYDDPVSPHLAVKMASGASENAVTVPSDRTFLNSVAQYIRSCARKCQSGWGLRNLAGISSTISSYESLLLRGYTVDAVILFRDRYYRNYEYLSSYFATRGLRVLSVDPPPPRLDNHAQNAENTEAYYAKLPVRHLDDCHTRRIEELDSMPRRTLDTVWWPFVQHGIVNSETDVTVIDSAWGDFFSTYEHASGSPSKTVSTHKSLLSPQFDSSASWWTQTLGHSTPSLALAAASAAGRYGHVIFPEATHLPALKLAERLVNEGPGKGWASRAFFSDNGSTGTEVALKMALRAFSVETVPALTPAERQNLGVIGLKGSYHGDTIGAMDATEESIYSCEWHRPKGFWFDPPTVSIKRGKLAVSVSNLMSTSVPSTHHFNSLDALYDVEGRLSSSLAEAYRLFVRQKLQAFSRTNEQRLAALMLEPIVMGAGGMIFVDPLFQRVLVDLVRDVSLFPTPLPVIYDEVFTGLYRLGLESAIPLLGASPDISVYAKMLTGGTLPLAVTLASDRVFQAFNGESKADALLHGHSYTAHPIGCQVANETLKLINGLLQKEPWKAAQIKWSTDGKSRSLIWSFWEPSFAQAVSHLDIVEEVMTLGTVFTVKFSGDNTGYASHCARELLRSIKGVADDGSRSSARASDSFGIHFRTLGNAAYFMTSLNTPREIIEEVENRIWVTLNAQNRRILP